MDFKDYKFKLTFRAACLYEQMTGKSYFKLSTDPEDVLKLTYCMIVANNENLAMSYPTFIVFMGDKKVSRWINAEYDKIAAINSMFTNQLINNNTDDETNTDDEAIMTMTDIVSSLIMQYNLDPHYVMNEMQMWEIRPYLQCAENIKKSDLTEKRMWTYLQMAPHIDTKKVKSPEKLLPFSWEAGERKINKQKELENNQHAIKNLIGKKLDWIK